VGKYLSADLKKCVEAMALSRRAMTFNVMTDGPRLLVSFEGDDGTIVTVTLFDESTNSKPTISKTESL
jgi:hypothetical protein